MAAIGLAPCGLRPHSHAQSLLRRAAAGPPLQQQRRPRLPRRPAAAAYAPVRAAQKKVFTSFHEMIEQSKEPVLVEFCECLKPERGGALGLQPRRSSAEWRQEWRDRPGPHSALAAALPLQTRRGAGAWSRGQCHAAYGGAGSWVCRAQLQPGAAPKRWAVWRWCLSMVAPSSCA